MKVNAVLSSSLCISWQMTGTTFASNHTSVLIMPDRHSAETIAQRPAFFFFNIRIFTNLKKDLDSGESYIFMFLIVISEDIY